MTAEASLDKEIKNILGFSNPLKVLESWLDQALKLSSYKEDHSWFMVLSTSYKNQVSSRVVLLKEINKAEIIFYTNYLSEKGRQINKNPHGAVNFYWPQLKKQIRLEGRLAKTSRQKSITYWGSRSRQSQISQKLSLQSQSVSSKKELLALKKQTERQFKNKAIPCPQHWGGYRLKIKKIEFWIEGRQRLHDRFLFERKGQLWKSQRLFP